MKLQLVYACLMALPFCAMAQTYKCKSPDGKVSFQDRPCQGGTMGAEIVVKPVAPSADPAEIERMKAARSREKDLSEERLRFDDDARARRQQSDAYNRAARCGSARQSLGVLKSERRVFRYDNNGEKQYIDDSARQAELAAAQRGVAENCN